MARYNSVTAIATASGTTSFGAPSAGLFTTLTGSPGYTVTLANPVLFAGQAQSFYNSTTGSVNVLTPTGVIKIPGVSDSATVSIPTGATYTIISDGINYIVGSANGAPINATTTVVLSPASANVAISPTGTGTVTISPAGAVTISPATAGSINNISIGASTRSTGAFTSLTSNAATTFTQNTASSSTSTGTLVVTGGVGISGAVYAGSIQGTPIGSISTSTGGFTTMTATTVNATTINETSSLIFKENITPINNALEKIMQLIGVTYDRKDTKKHEAGLIAEEVFKIIPELVTTDRNGDPYSLQYSKLTAYLIEAVKSLKQEIEELKNR